MSTSTRRYPVRGQVYTLAVILNQMSLDDSPALQFAMKDGRTGAMQDSHVTIEQVLSVPGMSESLWEFVRTTHEWIPIFRFVPRADGEYQAKSYDAQVLAIVDAEPYVAVYPLDSWEECEQRRATWFTPKGFPREQYSG